MALAIDFQPRLWSFSSVGSPRSFSSCWKNSLISTKSYSGGLPPGCRRGASAASAFDISVLHAGPRDEPITVWTKATVRASDTQFSTSFIASPPTAERSRGADRGGDCDHADGHPAPRGVDSQLTRLITQPSQRRTSVD